MDVPLSAATRRNLNALQDTAALTANVRRTLSSGRKVSSALDDPVNFFTARGLSSRAANLLASLDGLSNGVQALRAADQGITALGKLVDTARSTLGQALAIEVATTGTAAHDFAAAGGTVNFYVNGASTAYTIAAGDSIDKTVAGLGAAAGSSIFSKDATGRRIALAASADVEFRDAASQVALGFTAGTGTKAAAYGPGQDAVGQSADVAVVGVAARRSLAAQFNGLLVQITALAGDSSYDGVNLIGRGSATIPVATDDSVADVGVGIIVGHPILYPVGRPIVRPVYDPAVNSVQAARPDSIRPVYGPVIDPDPDEEPVADAASTPGAVAAANRLRLSFNETGTSYLDVEGLDLTANGLGLAGITPDSSSGIGLGGLLLDTDVHAAMAELERASGTLRAASSTFGSNLSVVQNRQDFLKSLVGILGEGASRLTDADLDAEAANARALAVRRALGVSSLSLAGNAQRSILQLVG